MPKWFRFAVSVVCLVTTVIIVYVKPALAPLGVALLMLVLLGCGVSQAVLILVDRRARHEDDTTTLKLRR